MTILQLKYVIALSNSASMSEAAGKLFISQPALSSTIKELEDEINIKLFERTNRGIRLTEAGNEFLAYAKQAVGQYSMVEDRYLEKNRDKIHFSVSMQHYIVAVHAFVDTLRKFDGEKYSYSVNETRTDRVLTDVRDLKSQIGVLAFSNKNSGIIKKLFKEYRLSFTPLFTMNTYAYMWKNHPLADRELVSLNDLKEYPCISFNQSSNNAFYLPEEALSDYEFDKIIKSNDRATSLELMAELNGYSIGTGSMIKSVTLKDIFVAIKLKEEDPLTMGYIVKKDYKLSKIGECYIEELKKYA